MEILAELFNGLVVIIGIYLAFRFDQKKSANNQIWVARKDAYSIVLSKLDRVAYYASKIDEGYNTSRVHPEEFHSSEEREKLYENLLKNLSECMESVRANRVIISDRFANTLYELRQKTLEIEHNFDFPPIESRLHSENFLEVHTRLLEIARSEVN
ncbi:MAG: hypothetical protein F4Y89_09375 [Gammaproteobacteria bacterium]|nr:hypothetical protein [Gammaproteobacteria bacterium]MYG95472.1 hypothetical protein [Gammaproteobacteria bacterium]